MKPDQVTDAMQEAFREIADYAWDDMEVIAAAYNAVVADNEPITAEWLDGLTSRRAINKRTYWEFTFRLAVCRRIIGKTTFTAVDDQDRELCPIKTRRQLLALLEGLGIEVGK